MPTSLIKITQGAVTDIPGNAVKGFIDGATLVVFSNGDNTGVVNWKFEVLYVPPGSAIPLTVQDGGVNTFSMVTPDAPGSYRVRLTVTDASGVTDVDIRNFVVPFPNTQILVPPYQANPAPLPLIGVGAKPDEMNIGGHSFGWDGSNSEAARQIYRSIRVLDAGGWIERTPKVNTADASVQTLDLLAAADLRDGDYEVELSVIGREDPSTGDHGFFLRRAAFEVTSGVVTQVGATQTPAPDLLDGAATWAVDIVTAGTSIQAQFNGAVGDTVDWTIRYKVRSTL